MPIDLYTDLMIDLSHLRQALDRALLNSSQGEVRQRLSRFSSAVDLALLVIQEARTPTPPLNPARRPLAFSTRN
jgi:hypothetical protein